MADVRFKIDHDQVGIVLQVMDEFLRERPRGETLNMLHSILQGLAVRLRRRHAERRLDYGLILPVYQALAFRRICMVGLELYDEGRARTELRILLAKLDPLASLVGKRIGIHAGKTWDRLALMKAARFLSVEQIHETHQLRSVSGAILCTAYAKEHRLLTAKDSKAALCAAEGLHGLVLEDVALPKYGIPVPTQGAQGIWSISPRIQLFER